MPSFSGRTAVRIPSFLGASTDAPLCNGIRTVSAGCFCFLDLCSYFVTILSSPEPPSFSGCFLYRDRVLSLQAACSRYFRIGTACWYRVPAPGRLPALWEAATMPPHTGSLRNIPSKAAPPRNGCGGNTRVRRISGFDCRS